MIPAQRRPPGKETPQQTCRLPPAAPLPAVPCLSAHGRPQGICAAERAVSPPSWKMKVKGCRQGIKGLRRAGHGAGDAGSWGAAALGLQLPDTIPGRSAQSAAGEGSSAPPVQHEKVPQREGQQGGYGISEKLNTFQIKLR